MTALLLDALTVIAPVSVALVVLAQGLSISPRQVAAYFRKRPGLMLRSLAAQLMLVPAVALGLILVMKPAVGVAVGLAILVSCPPAPLMIMSAPGRGGASAALMAGLHLSMAALAFVTVPAVLYVLSIPLGFHADVALGPLVWVLARSILLPIGLGLMLRGFAPAFAARIRPVVGKIGMLGVIAAMPILLLAFYPALAKMDGWSYLVIAAVSVVSLAIGHVAGPDAPAERTALAIECGVRHPTLALTIGAANFGSDRALPVLVPCILTFVAIATVYLVVRRRSLAI